MRLKCIKLAGFKSFVDPTTVTFPSNLCAVVGPNGCGKSNIIDAVRWVMGESSAKHLRGESMTDVIFNGSGGRKPVGQASIELVFDNSDGSLGGEYAGWSEISIKRKVTRDSQSNYYLNGNKCRRRDITDIFLGTGLGPRSYAIIEQGMISSLIEAKPDDLRVYIEEAAGISKYKERRRETESRMRRTKENLERLTDIREELGRQLNRLERQSQAAEKYAELKKEERQSKAELQALRWRGLESQSIERRKSINELELKVEALVTERSGCDTALERHRTESTEHGDTFNEVQGRYYSIGAEVARIEQAIQHVQDRAQELQQDLTQTERNFVESEEHLRVDRQKAQSWDAELQEISPELEKVVAAEELSQAALQQAEEVMQSWQASWDDFNHTASEPRQQAEVQQSRIQHLEQVLRRLAERLENIQSEHQGLSDSSVQEDITLLQEQLAEVELASDDKKSYLDTITEQMDSARQQGQRANTELDESRTSMQTMLGRKASLDALQQAALSGEGDQQQWLESKQLNSQPRLAETLQVEAGWETAVETVLGSYLQAVCVDNLDDLSSQLDTFAKGELVLVDKALDLDASSASGEMLSNKLSDKVNGEYAAVMLSGIYAVDDLKSALAMRENLGAGESVVTRDSLWMGANWLRVARDQDATVGVLKRRQELEALETELADCRDRVAGLEQQKNTSEKQLRDLEAQREVISSEVAEQQRQYAELRSKLSAGQMQVEQFAARRERAEQELTEAKEQQQQEQENLAEARQLLSGAIEVMEQDTKRREVLLQQRDDYRAALDQARQSARHDRDRSHELAMREKSVSTQLQSVREGIGRLEIQVARLQERREQLRESFNQDEDPTFELKEQLAGQLEIRLGVEKELADARRAVEDVEHQMRAVEQRRNKLEQEIQEQRSLLEQQRLVAQDLATRSKTIEEQISEHNFDLEPLLEALPEDADSAQWEQTLERIGSRIQRLGPINLAAIDEYKVESERKAYLDAQNAELEDALETLESAIRKIDRETRTRFKETFDRINVSLQELFPKLFGGGHAYLELTGEDLLDTGVTIMARPPGKKNTTVHLLSGGEKALTAIALVFSIFHLNPAPFCMLDEVDAPLDDANVARYARMVEEMSATVQFVYISHNKIAMEMANQLMGVTMYEPGVSRLVSVDVNQAVELAEA
ncbi:MAG: chromosome segregation protein SMC [Porticoccus sp.]|nr:chromosome segregation protein SMC [Porticoccus sp.]MBQ0806579.1 chromosome segregation protein SMC [Porticoccus sp.]